MRAAALDAARDPWTWVPLGMAATVVATDSDERISHWAKTENPLFGSREQALAASDRFRLMTVNSAWAAVIVTPLTRPSNHWLSDAAGSAGGSYAGVMTTRHLTGLLKESVQRERPHDGPTRDSFPSAHASDAFAHSTLARHHLERMPLDNISRGGLQALTSTGAAATAWARVEAGVHYPADVLFGAALANFTTRFFLELTERKGGPRVRIRQEPEGDGVIIETETPF
jgi:membrane-associated phospholipid phosphatase